jgi:hypothetical protein
MTRAMGRMAVVTTAHPWGDTRVFDRELAACLDRGLEVHLFIPVAEPWPEKDWMKAGKLLVHPLRLPKGRVDRLGLSLGVWRTVLAEGPFSLVHFHDPELTPAMAMYKLARPDSYVLYDIHEELPLQVESKPYLGRGLRRAIADLVRWAWTLEKSLFDGYAAATRPIAAHWPSAQTTVVHNFPKALFSTGGARPTPDPDRLLYVGCISEGRGSLVLLEAVRRARAERPSLKLDLVGDIQDASVSEGIEAAKAEGWCSHIPWLDPEVLVKHSMGAGLGLCPLLPQPNYLESLPTKIFEYMAMGVPVLASDFPLWRDLVEGPGAGRTVAPEPEALAKAILDMTKDAHALDAYAAAGQRAYQERYQWEKERERLDWHLKRAGLALGTD